MGWNEHKGRCPLTREYGRSRCNEGEKADVAVHIKDEDGSQKRCTRIAGDDLEGTVSVRGWVRPVGWRSEVMPNPGLL